MVLADLSLWVRSAFGNFLSNRRVCVNVGNFSGSLSFWWPLLYILQNLYLACYISISHLWIHSLVQSGHTSGPHFQEGAHVTPFLPLEINLLYCLLKYTCDATNPPTFSNTCFIPSSQMPMFKYPDR